jgi:hypothetical protein
MDAEEASFVLNLGHPDVLRAVLEGIVATGDVLGKVGSGRTCLAVTVDDWVIDQLAALGADDTDLEPEPGEDEGDDEEER